MVGVAAALITAAIWGLVAVRIGPRLGWVDRPDDPTLKAHRRPAVPLGGVGIFVAVHFAMALEDSFDPWLAVASAILLIVGLVDDRVSVPPAARLLIETMAGVILGLGEGARGPVMVAIVAVLVVVAVNAVNLFDGLDGLAGTAGAVGALGVAWLASSRSTNPWFGLLLAAAIGGFLLWNWHPARMFLGDNGAYVLAIFLVYGAVNSSRTPAHLVVAAVTLGVFLVDLLATLLRRVLVHQPLFSRDRLHLYDRLAARGLMVPAIAITAGLVQAALAAVVVIADSSFQPPIAILVLSIVGVVVVLGSVKAAGATQPGEWRGQQSEKL